MKRYRQTRISIGKCKKEKKRKSFKENFIKIVNIGKIFIQFAIQHSSPKRSSLLIFA